MINYTRKTVRGAGLVFVFSIFAAALGYLTRLVIARNLTLEEYGLFYSIFALVMLFGLFKDFGPGAALAKFIAEFKVNKEFGKIKGIISISFGFQTLFSVHSGRKKWLPFLMFS